MSHKIIYKIMFYQHDSVYELYAKHIEHAELFGFLEVEELVFGTRSGLLVDPSEEKLRTEFAGVKKTHIPVQSIIRIDEVEQEGKSKIRAVEGGSNISHFSRPSQPKSKD